MVIITDKITNYQRKTSNLERGENLMPVHLKEKISYSFKTPIEKYTYPMSSSQEYGWDTKVLMRDLRKVTKPQCDITKFANNYVASFGGRSPFSKKMPTVKK